MTVELDKLGHILLQKGIVSRNSLEKALKIREQEETNKKRSLAQILVSDLNIEHSRVFNEVANLYGFRRISLAKEKINEDRLEFIRKMFAPLPASLRELMKEEKILFLRYDRQRPYKIIIVAADPTNRNIPAIARAIGAKRYEICYVRKEELQKLLDLVFPPVNEFLKELERGDIEIVDENADEEALDEAAIEAEINKSVLVNLVEGMLLEAVRQGASDIHIFPKQAKVTEIHFRVDGKLSLWHVQDGIRPEAIAAVAKDRSKNIDRFERELAQDGFIQRKVDGHMIRFRVSVLPIVAREYQYKFESIVIRILDDRKVITDLDKLGFSGNAKELFVKAIDKPQGMVIVTGPTGSGKSTTLMAALSHVITPDINVLTVEDPVEYIISGARQLKIGPKMNFEQALRAILRHDPDVVMVGEIRDRETAETGIKLANTGHLTFSTLHTNDAPSAVSRLYKMGLEPFLIAYAINIIIAQRLIRRLCEKCKRPLKKPETSLLLSLGLKEKDIAEATFFEAVGCEHCKGGYKGRVAIHEALFFSKEIRKLIFQAGEEIDEDAIRSEARRTGMLSLREAGLLHALKGVTTIEEVLHATTDE